jgi:N-carbamoyl-L-amino-acid hydrolase
MHLRQDALLAAAQVILAVNRLVTQSAGEQVGTVGYLQVAPNASNTIASHVELRIDLRDLSQQHLDALRAQVEQELVAIAGATRTTIQMQEIFHVLPTLATPVIMSAISQVCHQQGLRTLHLPSRAGHDAQEIGRITDMGMIFVPSQQGISHSGAEYTSPQQCAQGADVLLQTLLQLDSLYPV